MPKQQPSAIAQRLSSILNPEYVDTVGRETGFCQRKRKITPYRLLLALIASMAAGRLSAIADILRRFNDLHQTHVHYKPFYNRLSHVAFPRFMRRIVTVMMQRLCLQVLKPPTDSPLAMFEDIVIEDGSSFRVKATTARHLFGGLSRKEPALRLHVSMSLFEDAVSRVVLTGNRVGETKRRVDFASLTKKLYLADRAYASIETFKSLIKHNASFVIRLSKSFNPEVVAVYDPKRGRLPVTRRKYRRFNDLIAQLNPKVADVEVNMGTQEQPLIVRVVVLASKEKHGTRLCTNLSHSDFSFEQVGDLYRLRWQIELLFKEWKSFTNLHRFDTQNAAIIEALVWASLAAAIVVRFAAAAASRQAAVPLSTHTAARSAAAWLADLITTAARAPHRLARAFQRALEFLDKNARRRNLPRDRKTGRNRSLEPVPIS